CFCGTNTNDVSTGVSSSCDYPCKGDPSQICGGYFAINVYQLGEPRF
ncbi:unnamed protein product, partial [Choristocarpus tenellus]